MSYVVITKVTIDDATWLESSDLRDTPEDALATYDFLVESDKRLEGQPTKVEVVGIFKQIEVIKLKDFK